ncbi:MAG TPA: hypothetical protein VFA95_01590 [Gammaproteobacteria bacterium]|nr:hypothetical protein [Gammaproteobacteria bacterium]
MGAGGSSIGWFVQPGLIYAGLMLLAVLVGGLLAFSLVMRRARRRSLRAADSRCAGEEVVYRDPAAVYIGCESRGDRQLRGNGVFVLTREKVFFTLWLPRREVAIPLERIRGIDTPRQFLGRSVGRRLLQIRYVDAEGQADAAAWFVRGLEDCCGFLRGFTRSPPPTHK